MFNEEIKVIVVDLDGTLTNGYYHVSDNGILTKSFNTKDFWALEMAQKQDLDIWILTGSTDGVIDAKMRHLPSYCKKRLTLYKGVENKDRWFESMFLMNRSLTWDNIAVIGDGGNDIEIAKKAAFSACPSDALEDLKRVCVYVSTFEGGKGAVCDIVMYLCALLKKRI